MERVVFRKEGRNHGQKCTFLHILKENLQQASIQEPVSTDRFSVRILKLGAGVASRCKQSGELPIFFNLPSLVKMVLSFHVFLSSHTRNEPSHTLLVHLFPLGVHPYGPRLPSFGADEASFYPCPPSNPIYLLRLACAMQVWILKEAKESCPPSRHD